MTHPTTIIEQEMVRRGLQTIRPGLSRIAAVCEALGHPENQLGEVIHVAGTNGKGSTCAFLDSLLQQAGKRTALFTSPHLVDICERVRLNGVDVLPAVFDDAAITVLGAERECGTRLTGFEFVTATGLVAMANHHPDISIVEVGMGGRLDATNVLRPSLTVITPIAMDHTDYLGSDLTTIAWEKGGIVKHEIPCLCTALDPAIRSVVTNRCTELDAPLIEDGVDFNSSGGDRSWTGTFGNLGVGPLALSLPGEFQQGNAALAVATAQQLLGERLTPDIVTAGLQSAHWPGRFQMVRWRGRSLLLDGAHNPHALASFLAAFRSRYNHRPDFLVALKAGKDVVEMAKLLASTGRWAVCTTTGTIPSVAPEKIALHCGELPTTVEPDLSAALDLLVSREGNNVVVCCGSFYLIGALLRRLHSATENS
jgi:dihydrofolate synthase / folylpolyglutamate synthase